MQLRLAAPIAKVRDLTAREAECCSFFTFRVSGEDGAVTLEVEVPPERADVLAALTERARAVAAGTASAPPEWIRAASLPAESAGPSARQIAAADLASPQGAIAERQRQMIALAEEVARLQGHPGTYDFPAGGLSCDLQADGGDARDRVDAWQLVLGHVLRREKLVDGIVLWFPFDVEIAGTLGRLAAAEYRCCSFGSYRLVIDGEGLRLEVRMPAEARGTMAAVLGIPST